MQTKPVLTDPSAPPSRADSANFSARADAFFGWFPTAWTNLKAVLSFVDDTATEAATSAASAASSATTASTKAAEASAAADEAASFSNVVLWVSGTSYAQGAAVWSPSDGMTYRRIGTTAVSSIDPAADLANWAAVTSKTTALGRQLMTVPNAETLYALAGVAAKYFVSSVSSMPTRKFMLAAAPLKDGRVLVCGGRYSADFYPEAHIYNPQTDAWTAVASMPTGKAGLAAALLKDGRVFVCGGSRGFNSGDLLSEAHIYNPALNSWAVVANMPTAKQGHAAATLSDGRVLVCGGSVNGAPISEAHIYDPTTNIWTAVASLPRVKSWLAAAPLSDGRVLVCGGTSTTLFSTDVYIYNPTTNSWTTAAAMQWGIYGHAAAPLSDGRVLVCGGTGGAGRFVLAYIYNPRSDSWADAASMPKSTYHHAAAPLSNGRVLYCGGDASTGTVAEAFIYNPSI